jgi:hypothetical protein
MIFICFFLLVGIVFYNNKLKINLNQLEKNKTSGYDERPCNQSSEGNISHIRNYFLNKEILDVLQSPFLDENKKLAIIYNTALFDDINPHLIKEYNLSKGLKW